MIVKIGFVAYEMNRTSIIDSKSQLIVRYVTIIFDARAPVDQIAEA